MKNMNISGIKNVFGGIADSFKDKVDSGQQAI